MAYVIAASFISIVVSLIYLGYVGASFRQVKNDRKRDQLDAVPASEASYEASEWESESPFSWKALISIFLSSVILFLMGKSAVFWSYVPFIAIGSAVAVIFAFTIDLRRKA
ncbi:hypothetical protein [Paenibacillus fonticola]|uniref:hypothetical protein n=1 Tax=Paenibacillus fonticola TaxID=379896 RepID=UPI00037EF132|nr:hypothetical protein [Paenibacillus fonticola]